MHSQAMPKVSKFIDWTLAYVFIKITQADTPISCITQSGCFRIKGIE